jgi:hypothetical protein
MSPAAHTSPVYENPNAGNLGPSEDASLQQVLQHTEHTSRETKIVLDVDFRLQPEETKDQHLLAFS